MASVITDEPCQLLLISRRLFDLYIQQHVSQMYSEKSRFVLTNPYIKSAPSNFKTALVILMRKKSLGYNEVMARQGQQINSVFFILQSVANIHIISVTSNIGICYEISVTRLDLCLVTLSDITDSFFSIAAVPIFLQLYVKPAVHINSFSRSLSQVALIALFLCGLAMSTVGLVLAWQCCLSSLLLSVCPIYFHFLYFSCFHFLYHLYLIFSSADCLMHTLTLMGAEHARS